MSANDVIIITIIFITTQNANNINIAINLKWNVLLVIINVKILLEICKETNKGLVNCDYLSLVHSIFYVGPCKHLEKTQSCKFCGLEMLYRHVLVSTYKLRRR